MRQQKHKNNGGSEMDRKMITTTFNIDGYKVKENLGMVKGIIVRIRSIAGNIVASLQSIIGGNITLYTSLCEGAREHDFRAYR
jgi:uncharacterized protein YbjQ (UPF0145 family)